MVGGKKHVLAKDETGVRFSLPDRSKAAKFNNASLAQLVEQLPLKEMVGVQIPHEALVRASQLLGLREV